MTSSARYYTDILADKLARIDSLLSTFRDENSEFRNVVDRYIFGEPSLSEDGKDWERNLNILVGSLNGIIDDVDRALRHQRDLARGYY